MPYILASGVSVREQPQGCTKEPGPGEGPGFFVAEKWFGMGQ